MNDIFSYHMPTKIAYGIDSFTDIERYIKNRQCLLVTSAGMVKRGTVDKLKHYTQNITHSVTNIPSHPTFEDLQDIYQSVHKLSFDAIIAIGGGSVIDAAKFLSVYNENRDFDFIARFTKKNTSEMPAGKYPIIAVPTTAGTGSEITPYATIWDAKAKKKHSLSYDGLFCETALYDPKLTLSVPKDITIQTGLDTLSHALEAIWNKNANPITLDYSIRAARLIVENLPPLVNDLENLYYRDNIMRACMYAGMAFSNTQTAIAHAMSYPITLYYGIPHGIACSFTLASIIDAAIGKYDFIDSAIAAIFGEASSRKIRSFFHTLNISTDYRDYKISEERFNQIKDEAQQNPRGSNSLVYL